MGYLSLEQSLLDLERTGQLVRVREEVDPHLQLAAIHLRVHEAGGPALLFENLKGNKYRAASNIFGTLERSKYIFRDTLETVQRLIEFKQHPQKIISQPFKNIGTLVSGINAIPLQNPGSKPVLANTLNISDLPLIHHWPNDGGAFVTMPQVYTEDADQPGIKHSNIGMYRIQLNGNDYKMNDEIGLHYQLHRGIGIHQQKANQLGRPLKVSVFVGGPPAHSVAAVMPLPEGISEAGFAGVLGGRRFRYAYEDGYCISTDADFVITGDVYPQENKNEGPFGDHLGYYSLQHPFPLMRVHKVYARNNAIWPFTVVGRPPQEDTSFGKLIHEITGDAIQAEIPGLKEIHAVDAAGVHPLLLAIGSERYTPYAPAPQPAEILTIANHILGTGQLSLAKFLFITADDEGKVSTHDIPGYLDFILKRVHLDRDLHFYTNTTIDTLDYSGTGLNSGSKVVIAAYGEEIRKLGTEIPGILRSLPGVEVPRLVLPGIIALKARSFGSYEEARGLLEVLQERLTAHAAELNDFPLLLLTEDTGFMVASLNNFLWATFTRCNPSHDIYGINPFIENKHWGCRGPLVLDCRVKPHHAPVLERDPQIERSIDHLFEKGGSLYKSGNAK